MNWHDHAGRMIDAIDGPDFGRTLAAAMRAQVPYDFTVIFGYVGAERPLDLYHDFPEDRRRLHVDEYQEGPYLLDPFFLKARDLDQPGLWRMREIAPDRFYHGEYYRSYYAQTGLAEEVGFLVDVNPNLTIVVSLMRKEKRFSNAEIKVLKTIWPVVDAASRRHWHDVALDAAKPATTIEARIAQAFHSIGEGILTPREREVVELTLKGHSADAIGGQLGISPGTVRIHRRNVYSKLRISSQGELFSEFISAMVGRRGANAAH